MDLKASVRFGNQELRWRQPLPGHPRGGLSLTAELDLKTPAEPAVFYACRKLGAADDSVQPLVLSGSQAARVVLNGREAALWLHSPDFADFADQVTIELPLQKGVNRLLLKLRYPLGPSQSI